jgi:hypothetical protein
VTPNKFLEDTLLHAKEGYRNTQDVIKFVDTKTAVVTGLSTLAAGALVTVVKWVIEADGESRANMTQIAESHPCLAPWFYAFVSLSLASALFCVGAAVWSVIARSRPKHLENRFTVLFPIYRYRDRHAACRTIEEKLRGMTPADMLSEYEDQLRIVGMIAGKKLKHIRFACFGLLTQLLCFVIAGVLLTMMYVSTEPRLHARAVLAANLVSPPSKTITCYPK